MKEIVEGGSLVFAAGDFQVIDAARRIVLDQLVDRLGPLLATPSPRGAELHDEDVPFESLDRIGFAENALNLKWRSLSADHRP